MKKANKPIIIAALFVMFACTSCGISDMARELEEKNVKLAGKLRNLENTAIPALRTHNENLQDALENARVSYTAVREAENTVGQSMNVLDAASTALANSAAATTIARPGEGGEVSADNLPAMLGAATQAIDEHNDGAKTVSQVMTSLDVMFGDLEDVKQNLEDAIVTGDGVVETISNEVVEVAEVTDTLARELAESGDLADSAAEAARELKNRADLVNAMGGIVSAALANIPGINLLTPPSGPYISSPPRVPVDYKVKSGGFPVGTVAGIASALLLGGSPIAFSKKLRQKVFRRKKKKNLPQGPGVTIDASVLGNALMHLDENDRNDRQERWQAYDRESQIEDELARRLDERKRKREALNDEYDKRRQSAPPQLDRVQNTSAADPGNSAVFSIPASAG